MTDNDNVKGQKKCLTRRGMGLGGRGKDEAATKISNGLAWKSAKIYMSQQSASLLLSLWL
jgi:hypothetical protein